MGIIKINSPEEDVLGYAKLTVNTPQIIDGIWLDINYRPIKYAYIGQKVIYRVIIKDVISSRLSIKLCDKNDAGLVKRAYLKPLNIKRNTIDYELDLESIWNSDLLMKYGFLYLYCEVLYANQIKGQFPIDKNNYLEVSPNRLYIMHADENEALPNMYTENGDAISISDVKGLMQDTFSKQFSNMRERAYDYIVTKIKSEKATSAARKFRSSILAILDNYGDLVDFTKVITGNEKVTNLALPLTWKMALLVIPADLVVTDFCNELRKIDAMIDMTLFENAKRKGIRAIYEYIKRYDKYQERFQLRIIGTSTAIKLLNGAFHSIEEVQTDCGKGDGNVTLLTRRMEANTKIDIIIIETIYWNIQ